MMKRLLVCHDADTETTEGLLKHLFGSLDESVGITVFHVLEHFPPEVLEHPGSEDPAQKDALENLLEKKRRQWIEERTGEARKVLQPFMDRLRGMCPRLGAIDLKIVPSYVMNDFLPLLKEELSSAKYDEVLIAHHPHSWLKKALHRTESDLALKELQEVNVRIIRYPH